MKQSIDSLSFQHKSTILLISLHENSVAIHDIISVNLFPPEVVWESLESLIQLKMVDKAHHDGTTLFTISSSISVGDILKIEDDNIWKLIFEKTTLAQKHIHLSPFTLHSYHVAIAYSRLFPPPLFRDDDIYAVRAFAISAYAQVLPILDKEALQKGIEIAVSHGDTAVQAILYSCIDVSLFSDETEAFILFDRAKELASLQNDYKVMIFVMKSITFRIAIRGRLNKTIEYYEQFMDELHPIIESLDYNSLDLYSQRIIGAAHTSRGLIAFCYYMTGQYARAITILSEMMERAELMKNNRLRESARAYLAHIFADQGDIEKARDYAHGNFEFWIANERESIFSWHASIACAALASFDKNSRNVKQYLESGHKYRVRGGFLHHYGEILMKTLEWYAIHETTPIKGISLNSEIKRLLEWPDIHMQGVAYLYQARKLRRENKTTLEIREVLEKSIVLLRKSGALPSLKKSIEFLCEIDENGGNNALKKEAEEIAEKTLYFEQTSPLSADSSLFIERMDRLILEINRMETIFENTKEPWNYITNQILHFTGAEKCVIIETQTEKSSYENKILSQLGSNKEWLNRVFQFIDNKDFSHEVLLQTHSFKKEKSLLVAIPYSSHKLNKKGFVCLESLHITQTVWENNRKDFLRIGTHFGVVYENIRFMQSLQNKKVNLEHENLYYRQHSETTSFGDIVGNSKEILHLKELIEKAAPMDTTILIQGETGSGKELIAREIYKNSSRQNGSFVVANIASISNELISSALFGHERGAFTGAVAQSKGLFELADGGTIFLDEIGDMSLDTQVHLLRVLQEGVFKRVGSEKDIGSDFRLIVATNKNLPKEVEAGRFREDLYYRISVFPIISPPLRQRKDDIPLLASFFMDKFSKTMKKSFTGIQHADVGALLAYDWPGNVRELNHIIERACVLSTPPVLEIPVLTQIHLTGGGEVHLEKEETLENIIKNSIKRVLIATKGKIHGTDGAAAILGLKPSTLYTKINKLGLQEELKAIKMTLK